MMEAAFDPATFRVDLLSTREREVLDLAVEGRTDEQISQALSLTTSTVNSYWVRIRGKLGQFSRTELVGMVLRHDSGLRHADLLADVARLSALYGQASKDLLQAQADVEALRGDSWHLLALDHVPEATLVCKPRGKIVYANLQAQHLFAVEPGELEGTSLSEICSAEPTDCRGELDEALVQLENAVRVVLGVERPFYVQPRERDAFRAFLVLERFVAPGGMMSVVNVREAMQDVEAFVAMLHKPFVLL